MQISYPSHHSWSKRITEDHIELFGESSRRKIKTTIDLAAHQSVTTHMEPLSEQTLSWFVPMYKEHIQQKQRPRVFNVSETTLNNPDQKKNYFSLSLFEGRTPLGATIFSLTNNRLSIAYRTYRKEWLYANLPASPSLYAEWAIADVAAKHKLKRFIHGRNRNPYGTFSSIGLAIFKLSVGCIPKRSKHSTPQFADTTDFTEDVLVLLEPEEKTKRLSSACLIVAEKNFSQYEQVTKYPERLKVDVLFRA